jgi:uncharacterized protein with ATP-grasp and redox domains
MCEFYNRKLPEPLRGKEAGTWAHKTITQRLPEIAMRVKKENDLPAETERKIDLLIGEIPGKTIRRIDDYQANDHKEWETYISSYHGYSWLEIPWFFAEFYFYRRILEAVGYFEVKASDALDPYMYQKEQGIASSQKAIVQLCENIAAWTSQGVEKYEILEGLLEIDFWGNQADLSLWPAQEDGDEQHASMKDKSEHILANDMQAIITHIQNAAPMERLDFILDNAGFELVCDLQVAEYCLRSKLAKSVVLHVKPFPMFVSDAMEKDVLFTIDRLCNMENGIVSSFGQNLDRYIEDRKLILCSSHFWGSPLAMWEMPHEMREDFSRSQLIVLKGDANYRRILGDRHWEFTTPFDDIVCYMPASLLALRVCKSEVALGLTNAVVQQTTEKDEDWLVDGNWGMIQFTAKPHD